MHPDDQHPDPDLVRGYITRRGVKTFHVADPTDGASSACGLELETLTDAGWARGLRRLELRQCANCAKTVDLDAPAETPSEPEELEEDDAATTTPPDSDTSASEPQEAAE